MFRGEGWMFRLERFLRDYSLHIFSSGGARREGGGGNPLVFFLPLPYRKGRVAG
jgi:hypothetical protein